MDGKRLQGRLAARGYAPGPVDGIVARRTYEALFAFAAGRALGEVGRALALAAEIEFARFGITTELRLAHFLAQIVNETGGFRRFEESLNYSVDALLVTFSRARISAADARRLGRKAGEPPLSAERQQAIANLIYGGAWGEKNLGNTLPGDGWRFRGRGCLQLTGRANYRAAATRLGFAFEAEPDLASRPNLALTTALDFWQRARVNVAADADDVALARRITNGGSIGLAEVTRLLARIKEVLL